MAPSRAEDFQVMAGREAQKGIGFDEMARDGSERVGDEAGKGRIREAGSQSSEQAQLFSFGR